MYNRYIPGSGGYTRIAVDEEPERRQETHREEDVRPEQQTHRQEGHVPPFQDQKVHTQNTWGQDLFRQLTAPLRFAGGENKNAGIAGILKALNLEGIDSGDLLLLLIILFLLVEGDNLELVITLGLMLVLSLGDKKEEEHQNE